MTSVFETGCQGVVENLRDLSLHDQEKNQNEKEIHELGFGNHGGCCAICLDKIELQETAMVKGCEHVYCVTCILRWASYKENPTCPQCKNPFEFLNVHRSLDGSLSDFMFEESVCLLLRASWFEPWVVENRALDVYDDGQDYFFPCEYENDGNDDSDDDLDEFYFHSSSIRIGNRRWGDNGYVRAGRQEARPVHNSQASGSGSGSGSGSREPKSKEVASKSTTGRRAKRAMKREAANKAAAAAAATKHQEHLVRFGRK